MIFRKGGMKMGKRKKTVDLLISLTLVATILVSVFVCSYPAVSAAESEDAVTGQEVGEELVDTAAVHRYASFDGVPDVFDADLRHDLSNLYLNQKTVYLDIYGRSQLNVIDAYSGTANAQMTFTSSNTSVAEVSAAGVIYAKQQGEATVTATDKVSGTRRLCRRGICTYRSAYPETDRRADRADRTSDREAYASSDPAPDAGSHSAAYPGAYLCSDPASGHGNALSERFFRDGLQR